MDISLIFEEPKLSSEAILQILPLAPLSMVSDIPGTYYKTRDIPDKFKICGLFENVLGWHFDKNLRAELAKEQQKIITKRTKDKGYTFPVSHSSYQPLLHSFFELGVVRKNQSQRYNDLWKKAFARMDADVHPKGTPNLDYNILKLKYPHLNEGKPLFDFFKANAGSFPMYYTSPTLREYVTYQVFYDEYPIEIKLTIHASLLELLKDELSRTSSAYLGNSEGWVEINLI